MVAPLVGVAARLFGGAAAKQGAKTVASKIGSEVVEEGAKGAGKTMTEKVVSGGLDLVNSQRQQAQQQRMNQQQRVQDAARTGANTGSQFGKAMNTAWDLLKQQTFNDYFGIKDQWISLPKEGMDQRPELYGEVADAMNIAYAPIGGHAKYGNADDLAAEDKHSRYDMLDYDEDPYVDAAKIYSSTPHGFKASLSAHDGSLDSKKRQVAYTENMLRTPGHYAEMSGPWFRVMERSGFKPLTDMSQIQQVLAGKNIQPSSDVEGGYVRNIGGVDHTKQIYGKPMTNEGHVYVNNLMQQMSSTEPLPVNFENQGFQFSKAMNITWRLLKESLEEQRKPSKYGPMISDKTWLSIPGAIPHDQHIVTEALNAGLNLQEAFNLLRDKRIGFAVSGDKQRWDKETIEQKLGRPLVESDYMTDEERYESRQRMGDAHNYALDNTPYYQQQLEMHVKRDKEDPLYNPFTDPIFPPEHPLSMKKSVLVKERKSPEAMRHKREYDKKYESSPERVKYREELNRERRRRGIYGSHDHMDVSHTEGGGLTLESQHANRGRHFKDKGTLRPIAKSLKDDLTLLRNLLAGPMDEQDVKIVNALMSSIDDEKPEPEIEIGHEFFGSR
tara:strand:+ start:119 stop:1954 length:1836 start_codon:yes stop_codon:yes gene_type:complete